ncbi:MAG: methylmalonyl-CoA mutase [Chloroflexi bacterium]|nr:methylmalonyl-CoA mutase [Chloroflexota bacterium]MCI0819402.1 methylmalonyl-CoA mutase [Chloroflexota bacterium]MCI0831407.1 methylmalonyl-CoA mutase [Chloroflexota bacterium]MCI0838120.1 methylmalonyl-CoA mutase [Chloroflexota bacterium]MCI0885584.1 methylmalonyl-CoA mutase [Chloroflexota bacterium]
MSDKSNGDLKGQQQRWLEERYQKAVEKRGERSDTDFRTSSTPVAPLYTPADIEGDDYNADVGFPGEYPYTRGVQPSMYRGRLWSIRQYAGYGTPAETNERFKFLLKEGQSGLSVAFDLPTQLGYDSGSEFALGEVGKVGVAIDTLADMETMFEGIPLDQVSTSMTINAPAPILVAMYAVVGQKQGVAQDRIAGTAQNDVLKEYVARGTYIYPPKPSLRLAADLMAHCSRQLPRFNAISISGYHMRDAGCTAAQEIAFTFANAIAYVDAAVARGVSADDIGPRISWIFNTQNNFLEEVAKYRTLRRMWARIMKDRFGATNPRSMMLRTHVQTGGATLTAQQPEVNIIRAALQGLASTLGGVQSLALSCYDEALALPTEKAQRIAVRTQQVIAYESGITDSVDPFGGSYYIENLTNELEKGAQAYLGRIEDMGGAIAAIESGYIQREIQEASYAYQKAIDDGNKVIVGVNRFVEEGEQPTMIFRPNPASEKAQIERLNKVRAERDDAAVKASLAALAKACRTDEDLITPIVEAVKAYASVGEISDAMRDVFGEYTPATAV